MHNEDERLAKWFQFWESTIQENTVISKTDSEGLDVVTFGPTQLKEWWISQYVIHNPKRFGFTAVQGSFERGPDLKVKKGRQWHWAEVEFNWKKYRQHNHHLSSAFSDVRYLIVLSAAEPSPQEAKLLPEILHIDEKHFSTWVAKAKNEYRKQHQPSVKLNLRMNIISNAMREMLFGGVSDGEDGPDTSEESDIPFDRFAIQFLVAHSRRKTDDAGNRWDISKATRPWLRDFLVRKLTVHCQMEQRRILCAAGRT